MCSLPRVSVITPSYNQAEFLEWSMRSVLRQGYPNLEYIVVDGGSTDGSIAVIEKYAPNLSWWVSERDSGQAEAINKGFSRAEGEIIAWLNSDDLYLPGAIAGAVEAFQADPALGMVYGNMLSIDATNQVTNLQEFGDWGLDGLMRFQIIGQPAVFLKREALLRAGFLDENLHYLLDHQLWLRIARHYPIKHFPQLWAAARYHTGAKNVAQALKFIREARIVDRWMQEQPDLADRYRRQTRRIRAGLACYEAHYLLDGGMPLRALFAYLKGFVFYPPTVLTHWRRIVFLLGGAFLFGSTLRNQYLMKRRQRFAAYQPLLDYLL